MPSPAFVVLQALGWVVGIGVIRALYPDLTPDEAAEVMLPQARGLLRNTPAG